ncbi:MAG: GAK system CofD-like protein [Candidatus Eisenbacteria bacterium]|nr:GAK system CofD-like protein [Candidatus Eisenbacteria bacterium]
MRRALLPDPLRVARYRRAPELGPRILFFSGGSALRPLCRRLKACTHNSIHLITPFDSGGSSAVLRRTFGMLSVGDLRNRLLALADESIKGNPAIYRLFSHRFSAETAPAELHRRLERLAEGSDELIEAVPTPLRRIIQTHLRIFVDHMPRSFDLQGASIGNLVLVGGYLNNDRDIHSVIFLFSKLVQVLGVVLPAADCNLHLEAELEDGSKVIGQHAITRPAATRAPINNLDLVRSLENPKPASVSADDEVRELVADAELLCYPMGSFFTSVAANLLPRGVGRAIAANPGVKVYIPNMGDDPEERGLSLADRIRILLRLVRRDTGEATPVRSILNLVLTDLRRSGLASRDLDEVRELGIQAVDAPLVSESNRPWIDPDRLTEVLLSLV